MSKIEVYRTLGDKFWNFYSPSQVMHMRNGGKIPVEPAKMGLLPAGTILVSFEDDEILEIYSSDLNTTRNTDFVQKFIGFGIVVPNFVLEPWLKNFDL